MWLFFTRTPRPDAPHWRGRRWCAAVDAIAWPLAWIAAAMQLSAASGIVRGAIVTAAAVATLRRLRRALWNNHRYHFSTWRWGRVLAILMLIGWALKLTLLATH